jgi:hypothetical protein
MLLEHYEAVQEAQSVIDRLRPSLPGMTEDIEDKMIELLDAERVEKTGDLERDFLAAYAMAILDGVTARN